MEEEPVENDGTLELRDKSVYPDESVLRSVLKTKFSVYTLLLELFSRNEMTHEWRYYHDGNAWLCKVQKKKKTVIWMSVWKGFVKATIYFPEKYLDKLYESAISDTMKESVRVTPGVGRSKPCIFKIKNKKILSELETAVKLKIECR